MLEGVRHLAPWRVIHNAVDVARYRFSPAVAADAPLVFLGRIEAIKGPHLAIDIARRSGRRLVIAGNVSPEHQGYFDQHVRPLIDGYRVEYIGPVDDSQKSELLSSAAALLMPILWEEPFGIVMAEALACGTPVVGLRRGAVPEVVDEGVTGFVRDTPDELVDAVAAVAGLDRPACRRAAEQRFSAEMLVDAHEALYRDVLKGHAALGTRSAEPAAVAAEEPR
jgi:glycosyltransferase involved in cell wall biosynthesis